MILERVRLDIDFNQWTFCLLDGRLDKGKRGLRKLVILDYKSLQIGRNVLDPVADFAPLLVRQYCFVLYCA